MKLLKPLVIEATVKHKCTRDVSEAIKKNQNNLIVTINPELDKAVSSELSGKAQAAKLMFADYRNKNQ
jgi:hypothetical protein